MIRNVLEPNRSSVIGLPKEQQWPERVEKTVATVDQRLDQTTGRCPVGIELNRKCLSPPYPTDTVFEVPSSSSVHTYE